MNKKIKKTAAYIAVLILAATHLVILCKPCHAADNGTMTVEQAVGIGLKNNYNIQIARHGAQQAQNNRGKGLAGFLPIVDSEGNMRYDAANENQTGSPMSFGHSDSRTWSSRLILNWTLFDGFRMFADKKRYDELADMGEYNARDTIEKNVVAIMTAFFHLVQSKQLLDVAVSTRDLSKTRLDRQQIRHNIGGSSSTDLLNARVNFNNDQTLLLNRELTVTIARKQLNVLLGRDPLTPVQVKKQIKIPPLDTDLDKLIQLAKTRNSTLLAADKNRGAAHEKVRIAKSVIWPQLLLNGSYGYTDRSSFGDDIPTSADRKRSTIDASIWLMLRFNLFNGNVDKINIANAHLDYINQNLAFRNTENDLKGLVYEKYSTYRKKIETLTLAEQNVITARQNMELEEHRYFTGASDSLNFRDAQVKLALARATRIVARFEARIALLDLHKLTGELKVK